MEAILKRAGARSPLISGQRPSTAAPISTRVLRMFYTVAERLPLPQREVPPEWFRFPLP